MKRQALRRNLEKIVLTSLQDAAPAFWRALAGDACGGSREHGAMREQLFTLLSQLLEIREIPSFLRELAAGRFEWPQLPAGVLPPGMSAEDLLHRPSGSSMNESNILRDLLRGSLQGKVPTRGRASSTALEVVD